uniref:Toxin co-regulated pilus biosynthesis protein Q C-terminal domain-containing protein n=1 Tax=mine drainage metagenome TaxID=410659 RepID=E6QGN2_9ZZZZ
MGKRAALMPVMLASLAGVGLAGCATTTPAPVPKMPINLMPGQADAPGPATPRKDPGGDYFASRVSGRATHPQPHWTGPVNTLMEQLAHGISWHAVMTYTQRPMPDAAVWNTHAPLVQIVHEINEQIQPLATVRILPMGRTLELTRYDPQWLPKHPTANTRSGVRHSMIAYPIFDQPAAQIQPAPSPSLHGFQKVLTIQPVLAQHGKGPDTACKGGRVITTLGSALQHILPTGWTVYAKPGIEVRFPAQYQCNGPWTGTLRDVLQKSGLHGAIWWGPRIVTLWPAPVLPTYQPTPHLRGYKQTHLRVTVDHPGASTPSVNYSTEASPLTKAQPVLMGQAPLHGATPVFLLNQGDLILTDLQKWAKQSGWTVVWQVPEDWQVPNTTTFSGNFQKAVSQVIQALSANGANVHAVFHTANNTVVISGAGGGE